MTHLLDRFYLFRICVSCIAPHVNHFTLFCAMCLIFNFSPLYVQITELGCFHTISQLMSESDTLVDGTTNFAHGYPSFAVSVGVLFRGKPATAAVVVKA